MSDVRECDKEGCEFRGLAEGYLWWTVVRPNPYVNHQDEVMHFCSIQHVAEWGAEYVLADKP